MNRNKPKREVPMYVFGAMKAAQVMQEKAGRKRKPAKPPATVEELQEKLKKLMEQDA